MRRLAIILLMLWVAVGSMFGSLTVTRYDDTDGLPDWHTSGILQDDTGLIWIATWSGLSRYDGYEFIKIPVAAPDGTRSMSQRICAMFLGSDGNIRCRLDDGTLCVFNTRTYSWAVETQEQWNSDFTERRQSLGKLTAAESQKVADAGLDGVRYSGRDRQGNIWALTHFGLARLTEKSHLAKEVEELGNSSVRAYMLDRDRRLWLTTKDDGVIRIYRPDGTLDGYLGADGSVHREYIRFGAAPYCILQTGKGTVWIGTKPGVLFQLLKKASSKWDIRQIETGSGGIDDMAEDQDGRLWVATRDSGIFCITQPDRPEPQIVKNFDGYPTPYAFVRRLYVTRQGLFLCGTNDGLVVAEVKGRRLRDVRFRIHRPERGRHDCLSASMVRDFCEDGCGNIYIVTSNGVDRINSASLLSCSASFEHIKGLTDDVLSIETYGRRQILVHRNYVSLYDTVSRQSVRLDANYWGDSPRFNETGPLHLGEGRWLFGCEHGAFLTDERGWLIAEEAPPLIFTSVTIGGQSPDCTITAWDTLRLAPDQRNLSLTYAALDYSAGSNIRYRTSLTDGDWTETGCDRTLTFYNLSPGTYNLEVCSTDAFGRWTDNTRRLVIVAEPAFKETPTAKMLLIVFIVTVLGAVTYTVFYIRALRRQRQQTLDAYLELISQREERVQVSDPPGRSETVAYAPEMKPEDEVFMQRLMAYVEENIGNAESSVIDMASGCACSESSLYRKTHALLGVSPGNFLQEARLKHAARLLTATDTSVTDIAYESGFTDPKYFSKCFKKRFELSPSEFRIQKRKENS